MKNWSLRCCLWPLPRSRDRLWKVVCHEHPVDSNPWWTVTFCTGVGNHRDRLLVTAAGGAPHRTPALMDDAGQGYCGHRDRAGDLIRGARLGGTVRIPSARASVAL